MSDEEASYPAGNSCPKCGKEIDGYSTASLQNEDADPLDITILFKHGSGGLCTVAYRADLEVGEAS